MLHCTSWLAMQFKQNPEDAVHRTAAMHWAAAAVDLFADCGTRCKALHSQALAVRNHDDDACMYAYLVPAL